MLFDFKRAARLTNRRRRKIRIAAWHMTGATVAVAAFHAVVYVTCGFLGPQAKALEELVANDTRKYETPQNEKLNGYPFTITELTKAKGDKCLIAVNQAGFTGTLSGVFGGLLGRQGTSESADAAIIRCRPIGDAAHPMPTL